MPDGEHFVVGVRSFRGALYHVDGTLPHLQGHTWCAVEVTQDGQRIVSGSFDHTVKVWNV